MEGCDSACPVCPPAVLPSFAPPALQLTLLWAWRPGQNARAARDEDVVGGQVALGAKDVNAKVTSAISEHSWVV